MNSKRGLVVDDEDMDINVDDDEDDSYERNYKTTKSDTLNIGKFSFSITNILSDQFGPKPVKIENDSGESRLFRPFEIKNFINNSVNHDSNTNSHHKMFVQNLNPSSVFLNSFRLSELFDYSTKNLSSENYKSSDNSLRNSFYNSFTSYPKLQDETLSNSSNSHKKYSSQVTSNLLSSPSLKVPSSIGGLCKTISQIGQESLPQSLSTSSTSSLKCTSPTMFQSKSNSSDTLKLPQSSVDSMSLDSDDCQSEASKDENQKMWPAWVIR